MQLGQQPRLGTAGGRLEVNRPNASPVDVRQETRPDERRLSRTGRAVKHADAEYPVA